MKIFFLLFAVMIKASIVSPEVASSEPVNLQTALEAYQAGRYALADDMFEEFLQQNKTHSPDIVFYAARAAYGAARYKKAYAYIKKYLGHASENILYKMEADALQKQLEQALTSYEESDQAAFDFAQQQGTIFAYAAYRNQYPDSENVKAADFLSFTKAKEINVEVAYLRYLEHWPKGLYVKEAKRGADTSAFRVARQMNTLRSYQIYVSDYPNGIYLEQARQREESISFFKAKKDGSVEAVKKFLVQYPNGLYRSEAEKTLASFIEKAPLRNLSGSTVIVPKGIYVHKKLPTTSLTQHSRIIEISRPFTAMAHEITFNQWDTCVAEGGCNGYVPDDMGWGRGSRPVINVSKLDIDSFIRWFNAKWQKAGGTGLWRLPGEIEWAYMARGTKTPLLPARAAFDKTGKLCPECDDLPDPLATFPVGLFKPNDFGLYDMLGNVAEWVSDCWHHDFTQVVLTPIVYNCVSGTIRGAVRTETPAFLSMQARQEAGLRERNHFVGFRLVLDR